MSWNSIHQPKCTKNSNTCILIGRLAANWEPSGCSCIFPGTPISPSSANPKTCVQPWFQPISHPHILKFSTQLHSFNYSLQLFSLKIIVLRCSDTNIPQTLQHNTVSFDLTIHHMEFKDNSTSNLPPRETQVFPLSKPPQNPDIIKSKPKRVNVAWWFDSHR